MVRPFSSPFASAMLDRRPAVDPRRGCADPERQRSASDAGPLTGPLGRPHMRGRRRSRVPPRIRLVHKTLLDGRYHVFTSPDLKGLHVSHESLAKAQREVLVVLDRIARRRGAEPPIVEFIFENVSAAA